MSEPARHPLSLAQQRLWLLEQLEPGSRAYHMRTAQRITGELDAPRLELIKGLWDDDE